MKMNKKKETNKIRGQESKANTCQELDQHNKYHVKAVYTILKSYYFFKIVYTIQLYIKFSMIICLKFLLINYILYY